MSKKLFTRKKPKLFKPKIRNNRNRSARQGKTHTFSDFKNTNIESTASFRYDDKVGVVSTQEMNINYANFGIVILIKKIIKFGNIEIKILKQKEKNIN